METSVQVESEDQEDIITNTPSKRRTRAMRIVDDDDDSPVVEEEEEADDGEEDAEGVRFPPLTTSLVFNRSRLDSQKPTNWNLTRNLNSRPLLHRG